MNGFGGIISCAWQNTFWEKEVLEEHVERLLLSTVVCPALQSFTQTIFRGKIEGTREIRGLYILILVQIILNALAFNNFKKIPLRIFFVFPTLMGHIFLDHPLMFCFVGWCFLKQSIKSDLSWFGWHSATSHLVNHFRGTEDFVFLTW